MQYPFHPDQPHEHVLEPTCACGANRQCKLCGNGQGQIPCACSGNAAKDFNVYGIPQWPTAVVPPPKLTLKKKAKPTARILPFTPRDVAGALNQKQELTPKELYNLLVGQSLHSLEHLMHIMKLTGKWNDTAEALMSRVVQDVTASCVCLSGVDDGSQTCEI